MSIFSAKFSESFVVSNAILAEASYADGILTASGWSPAELQKTKGILDANGYFTSGNAAARVYVNKSGDVTIAFRGTDSILGDSKEDLKIFGRVYPSSYTDKFKALIDAVKKEFGNKITFSGHSLGGAVVNDISTRINEFGLSSDSKFIAFSSPLINSNTFNFGHDNDFIYKYLSYSKNAYDNVNYYGYYNDIFGRSTEKSAGKAHSSLSIVDTLKKISISELSQYLDKNDHLNSFGFSKEIIFIKEKFYNKILLSSVVESNIEYNLFNNVSVSRGGVLVEENNDYVVGSKFNDTMDGLGGEDILYGGGGRDVIFGNSGNDQIFGESENDIIFGGKGNDVIVGGIGLDVLRGGENRDTFRFAPGDVVKGELIDGGGVIGEGNQLAGYGSISFYLATIKAISEVAFEKAGRFQFDAKQISDTGINLRSNVFASAEKDELVVAVGTSTVGGTLNLSGFQFDPRIAWSAATDRIYLNGYAQGDTIIGTTQNDIITGSGGADTLRGGAGNDTFYYRGGDTADKEINGGLTTEINRIYGYGAVHLNGTIIKAISKIQFSAAGKFYFDGSQISAAGISATTQVQGSTGANELIFNVGSSIQGGKANLSKLNFVSWSSLDRTYLNGSGFADTIVGSSKADTIKGAGGNDSITGGLGADNLYGGTDDDLFRFASPDISLGEVINGGSLANGEKNTLATRGNVDFSPALIAFVNNLLFESAGSVSVASTALDRNNGDFAVTGSIGKDTFSVFVDEKSKGKLVGFSFDNQQSGDIVNVIGSTGNDILRVSANAKIDGGAGNDIIDLDGHASSVKFGASSGIDLVIGGLSATFDFGTSFDDFLALLKNLTEFHGTVNGRYTEAVRLQVATSYLYLEDAPFTPENTNLEYEKPIVRNVKATLLEGQSTTIKLSVANPNDSANYQFSLGGGHLPGSDFTFDAGSLRYDIRAGETYKYNFTYYVSDGYDESNVANIEINVEGVRQTHQSTVSLDLIYGASNVVTSIKESELREGHWINIADLVTPANIGVNATYGSQGLGIDVYDSPGDEPIKFEAIFGGVSIAARNDLGSSYDFTDQSYYTFRVYATYNTADEMYAGVIGHDFTVRIIDDLA